MYIIVFSFNFLTMNELSTERHFIVWAAKLNHHIYFKGILTSEFVLRICCFGKEVLLLFPQKMRIYGFLPD